MPTPIKTIGDLALHPAETPEAPPDGPRVGGKTDLEKILARIWNRYGGAIAGPAAEAGLPVDAALAVFAVEAGGQAFDPRTGLVMIRFEPHVFRRQTGAAVAVRRGGQTAEWINVEKAVTVDLSGALLATSWGLPQLMGFNWRITGRPDVRSMVLAFQRSVHDQVAGFFGFVQSNGLAQAILDRNWRAFARRYNGPGQVDHYAGKLTEALGSARRLLGLE